VRVVFFGTPEFAVPPLRALLGEGFDVVAAVTQPDKPQGRSRTELVPPPVKVVAQAEEIPVLQPERPTDKAFLQQVRELTPDIGVVVAYGHVLKPELLAIPARGMVNVHPSLLPALRGAAPVEWSILKGLETTGVTIMQMDAGLDSGPILLQLPTPVQPDETGGELTERLAELGAQALVEALALLAQGSIAPRPQDDAHASYAPKLTRETARIDWTAPAEVVARTIRALDPRPGAWTELAGEGGRRNGEGVEVKLFGARVVRGDGPPGEVLSADGELVIAAVAGAVAVEEVQQAGKPRMPTADWIRGRAIETGRRFT
jgi:methionyl-tRNA formyltransferase